MRQYFRRAVRFTAFIGSFVIVLMALLVIGDAAGRYIFHRPIPGTYELVAILMVAAVYLSLPETEERKANIRVEILTPRLSQAGQDALDIFASIVGAVTFGVVTWLTGIDTVRSWKVQEASAGLVPVPLYPSMSLLVLGCGVLTLVFLLHIVDRSKRLFARQGRARKGT